MNEYTDEKYAETARRLTHIRTTLREGVNLVAVSKFHPAEALMQAYRCGQRIFGESRVQEMQAKHETLPADIQWHFIGHLQQNKVKYIAPYVSLIHAVDSERLLAEIDKQGAKCGRVIPCLLEVHVAQEETKYGLTPDQCSALLAQGTWRNMPHVRIDGLMCMASNTDDMAQVRAEFHRVRTFFDKLKANYFAQSPHFAIRSWGMSHDYAEAMNEGATHVRIGTAIFGEREY